MPDAVLPAHPQAAVEAAPAHDPALTHELATRWRLLAASFQVQRCTGAIQAVPALGALIAYGFGRQAWYLAWAAAVLATWFLARRVAIAFDMRAGDTGAAQWAGRHAGTAWAQAAILGIGGGLAAAGGNPVACLVLGALLCFVAGADAAQAVLARPAHGQLLLLLGPMLAGGLFGQQQAGMLAALLAAMVLAAGLALAAATAASAWDAAYQAEIPQPQLDSEIQGPPAARDFQRLLTRDEITGLPNRHSFAHLLAEETARACRAETKLSLLLLHWNEFDALSVAGPPASVNERLAGLAHRLAGGLQRSSDVLASLGVGRFAVLLPFTDGFGAAAVAHKLQTLLRANAPEPISVCIGAASYCGKGPLTNEELMQFAEQALAAALKTGGDCIKMYDPAVAMLRPAPHSGARPKEEAMPWARESIES